MDFQFQAWERLTEEVTDGDADLCIAVAGRKWLWLRCGELQFVRPFNRPAREWNYLLRSHNEMLGLSQWFAEKTPIAEVLADRDSREIALCRYWKLAEKSWAIWSSGAEFKLVQSLEEFTSRRANFYFMLGRSLAVGNARSSRVFEQLQRDWENPTSSLSVTARYLELPEADRELYDVRTRFGTPQEFVVLVRHLLRLYLAIYSPSMLELKVTFALRQDSEGFYKPETLGYLNSNTSEVLCCILRVFEPHLIPELVALPTHMVRGTTWFTVHAQSPSAHEQIEAALQLRDWLQTHWPDGVKHLDKIV